MALLTVDSVVVAVEVGVVAIAASCHTAMAGPLPHKPWKAVGQVAAGVGLGCGAGSMELVGHCS